ncbi:hypothetical protein Ddc_09618 [Ditylenchus destructor]|nr:hypothetical protein Ddc_09618 [Ditylenchus destructor]
MIPPPPYAQNIQKDADFPQVNKNAVFPESECNSSANKLKAYALKLWYYATKLAVFLCIDIMAGLFLFFALDDAWLVRFVTAALVLLSFCIYGLYNKKPAFCLPYLALNAIRAIAFDFIAVALFVQSLNSSYRRQEYATQSALMVPVALIAHLSEFRVRKEYCNVKAEIGGKPIIQFTLNL